ncbi:extracellular solute-binding protein [Aristophania vespae]|uniref:extracellular solute-binding protein n=1 Tax=Aristophania vespae TaxID=2697033 RepID=UPI0023519926|nr:extracellular solute-binding protein [Aristophania vespae]
MSCLSLQSIYDHFKRFCFLFFIAFTTSILLISCNFLPQAFAQNTVLKPLVFAVPETLLSKNWLFIPDNFKGHFITWDELLSTLHDGSLSHPPLWDAIMVSENNLALGCAQGWLKIFHENECGRSAGYLQSALIWDKKRIVEPPNWAALWDVIRFPGKRSFPQQARGTLETALLANGVPPAKIYATLSTQKGLQRAFNLLEQLRPYIVWYRTPNEYKELLLSKSIIFGVAPLSTLPPHDKKHKNLYFVPEPEYSFYSRRYWGVPSYLSKNRIKLIEESLDTSEPHLSSLPKKLPASSLFIDDRFWMAHGPTLEPLFKKWLKSDFSDFKPITAPTHLRH